ncbi:MAG: DUF4112 domain-containing protein [Methyloceanibacter sp.]
MSSTEQAFGRRWHRGGSRGGAAAADFLREFNAGLTHRQRLEQVRFIARLMDDRFAVPGTKLRFGLDSLIGIFPGLGDVVTSAISLFIVHHAWQAGASKLTLARMLGNVGIDFVVGAVPLVGDLFDFVFKANRKNMRLLEAHLTKQDAKGMVEILPPLRQPPRK